MLDNEPVGGDSSGTDAAPAAENSTTTRRTRTSRRRATAETAAARSDAPAGEDTVANPTEAGTADAPVKKATRRRKKAAEAATEEPSVEIGESPQTRRSGARACPPGRRPTGGARGRHQPRG
jgi:ribonuclease E